MSVELAAATMPGVVLWLVTIVGLVVVVLGIVGIILDMRRRHRGKPSHQGEGVVAKMLRVELSVSESVGVLIIGVVCIVGVWVLNAVVEDDDPAKAAGPAPTTTSVETTVAPTTTSVETTVGSTTTTVETTLPDELTVSFPDSAYGLPESGGWYNAPGTTVAAELRELGLKVRVFEQGCSSSVDEGNVRMITYGGKWNEGIVFGKSSDNIDEADLANLVTGDEVQVWLSSQRPCP